MILRDEKKTLAYSARYHGDGKTNRHIVHYSENGLPGVERHLRDNPGAWRYKGSTEARTEEWDLGLGYEGACRLAKEGWSEGAAMLDAKLGAVIPSGGRSSRWGYSQTGGSVNIGRYLTGHPKNMRSRTKRQAGSAPVYHLVINTVCSALITATQMVNYGVALVGLIDRLENTGKRVHLDVVMVTKTYCSEAPDTRLSVGWNVKRSSEQLDLAAVAFALAHPAAFRRLGFAMMERSPKECESDGYGMCIDAHWSDVPDADDGTMVIDGIQHSPSRCNSPQDALRLVIEQLNKAAVLAGHCEAGGEPLIDESDYVFDA